MATGSSCSRPSAGAAHPARARRSPVRRPRPPSRGRCCAPDAGSSSATSPPPRCSSAQRRRRSASTATWPCWPCRSSVAGRNRAALELVETRAPRAFSGANVTFAEFMARQAARLIAGDEGREDMPHRALDLPRGRDDRGAGGRARRRASSGGPRGATAARARRGGLRHLALRRRGGGTRTAPRCRPPAAPAPDGGRSFPAAEFGAVAGALASGTLCAPSPTSARQAPAGPHAARRERDGARSVLATAVRIGDDVVGLLQIYGAEPGWILGREELALLEAGAAAAALVLSGRHDSDVLARRVAQLDDLIAGHGVHSPGMDPESLVTDDAACTAGAPRTGRLHPVPRRGRRRDAVSPRRRWRQPLGGRTCVAPGRLPYASRRRWPAAALP